MVSVLWSIFYLNCCIKKTEHPHSINYILIIESYPSKQLSGELQFDAEHMEDDQSPLEPSLLLSFFFWPYNVYTFPCLSTVNLQMTCFTLLIMFYYEQQLVTANIYYTVWLLQLEIEIVYNF